MVRPPRGSTRSSKYIVQQAASSEAAGTQVVSMCLGADDAVLSQSGSADITVPVGAKVKELDIRMPKVNLGAATANFIHWTIQRIQPSQAVLSPILTAGSTLRRNVMLSGVIGLGAGQNNSLHVKYKIPKTFWRMGDGQSWQLVMDNGLACSTVYQIIYKVFM